MSIHYNYTGRIVLQMGIILFLSVFSLTGCSQVNNSNVEVYHEAETTIEDELKQQEIVSNMPLTEVYPDGTVSVEMRYQKQYTAWIRQLENYTDCIELHLDMQGTDVTVYLDEILAYGNFKYLTIENGGTISIKDSSAMDISTLEKIVFDQVFAIDERSIACMPKQVVMRIQINDQYKGIAPAAELLLETDCQNAALQWQRGKALDRLSSILMEEQRILGGLWKLNSGDFSYTEYEFYDLDTGEILEAFICIKDQESNGEKYIDIVNIPVESLQQLSFVERERMRLEDVNSDGYLDIVVVGAYTERLGELNYETFLWNDSKKEYELVTEGRRSNSQISVRRIADGYEVKLYDQVYNEVFSMIYPREPWIAEVTENVLEVGVSTGSPARNVFYFDKDSGRTSIGYMNSRLIDENYVAYMDNGELIFTDLFSEEIYLEIKRDFAPAVDPVISIEMPDSETILLRYYKGEEFLEVQEAIRIRKELNVPAIKMTFPQRGKSISGGADPFHSLQQDKEVSNEDRGVIYAC